jgi:ComF family protein
MWTLEEFKENCADALALVLPISCAGCDLPDRNLCTSCRAALIADLQYRELFDEEQLFRLPLWFAMELAEPLSGVLHHFKERGRTSVAKPLAVPLREAMKASYQRVRDAGEHRTITWVVPPSSRASFRKRGYSPIALLAQAAGVKPQKLLAINRKRADQSELGRAERFSNMKGVYRAKPGIAGKKVILVDDVVTTGATLLECARALRAGGAEVLGAAVLSYTPKNFQDTRRENA